MKDVNILTNNGINVEQALGLFGTMEKYDNVLDVFYNTIEDKLTQLSNSKAVSDYAQYRLLVHALKSEAGYFGCVEFQKQAYQHEIAAKNHDIDFIGAHFDELMTEIRRVVKVVGGYLGKEAAPTPVTEAPQVEAPATQSTTKNRIIVIDESNMTPHLINQVFHNQFEISLVNNATAAVNLMNASVIGIILNLQMQTANGIEILNVVKNHQLFPSIPVCLIVDGHVTIPDIPYPNIDILRRPFHERDIKEKVEKFLIFNK